MRILVRGGGAVEGLRARAWLWSSLVLQMLLVVPQSQAGEMSFWESNAKAAVPVGAQVTLETDRTEYFLGEKVLVHFTLENTGDQAFEADFGGDYRGSTRHLRFKVTATDASGGAAEDPDPSRKNKSTVSPSIVCRPLSRDCRELGRGALICLEVSGSNCAASGGASSPNMPMTSAAEKSSSWMTRR